MIQLLVCLKPTLSSSVTQWLHGYVHVILQHTQSLCASWKQGEELLHMPKNPTASLEELAASSMTRFHTGRSQLWDSVWAIWLVLLGACPSYWPHCQKLALCNLQIELSACSAFLSLLTESPQILLRSAARPRTRQVHTAVL